MDELDETEHQCSYCGRESEGWLMMRIKVGVGADWWLHRVKCAKEVWIKIREQM